MKWVGAPAAPQPIFIFRKNAAQGSAKRLEAAAAATPERSNRLPPVRRLDAAGLTQRAPRPDSTGPCCVPGPLAPGRTRQHPPELHRHMERPAWSSPTGALALDQEKRSRLAMRKPAVVVDRGIAGANTSCRCRFAAPASQTGRSDFAYRGRGPAVRCGFASEGGRRGDVSSTECNERSFRPMSF